MIKSISQWAFPGGMSYGEMFKAAAAAGFDAFEVAMDEKGGPLTLRSSERDVKKIVGAAKKHKLQIAGLATGLFWRYQYTDDDPELRKKARQITRRMLKAANWLGVDAILVVPGMTWRQSTGEKVRYDVAYDRALGELQGLARDAERHQVAIGVENVWNRFLLSPLEMRDFIDKIGSNYVKVYFDVGNVLQYSVPEHWIEILGKRIVRVHVKDFKLSIGNMDGFVDLLAGDVDWPAVMAALRKIGYNSFCTVEIGPYQFHSTVRLKAMSQAMDVILAMGKGR